MHPIHILTIASILLICLQGRPAGQTTVTIDKTTTYQTITGIGAFAKLSAARPRNELYDLIAFDGGFSMFRHEISPYCKLAPDDPFNIDVFVFGGPTVRENFEKIRALRARGVTTFLGTVWSPPAWMKTNGHTKNGGSLKRDHYSDFADYLVTYIEKCKEVSGVELYAVCLQNELEWAQPYNSCVYQPNDLRDLIKVVKPRFEAAGLQTRIIFPKHMADLGRNERYIDAVLNDPVARDAADVVAVTGFMLDGADPNSADARNWQTLFAKGDAYGKPLWMTETSGYFWNNWDDCMRYARALYTAFAHGHVSAWTWWSLDDPRMGDGSNEKYALCYDGRPTPLFWIQAQFARFVRPGSKQVKALSSSSTVLALAFHHETDTRTSLVLINTGAQQTVSVSGIAHDLHAWTTTATSNLEYKGTVSSSEIVLPASSITTLVDRKDDLRAAATPILFDCEVSAGKWIVAQTELLSLQAQPVDQYGNPFAALDPVTWSVSQGASVSISSGNTTVFSSPNAGTHALTISCGTSAQELPVTVFDPQDIHLKINCGGIPYGEWQSDKQFAKGGQLFYFGFYQDPSGAQNAAPAEVYQTVRHTPHDYSIPLPNGNYTVRMHFADHYGGRTMRYTVEGQVVLENFDIEAAAGGLDKGVSREFIVPVTDGNGLQIECNTGGGSDVFEAGLEILGKVADGWTGVTTPAVAQCTIAPAPPVSALRLHSSMLPSGSKHVYRLNGQRASSEKRVVPELERRANGVYVIGSGLQGAKR